MTARGFDPAAIDLKDLRDPRGFAPPPADTAQRAGVGIQASDEVPEDGGDDGGPAAQGEEAKRGAGDGHAAVAVANVIRALDQASKPKASRRCREVRRCCPPTPPTSVWSSVSV